jgi:hypothetical protein
MSLSPHEIEAEARRVLPHLAARQRALVAIGNGVYGLVRTRGKSAKHLLRASEEVVSALLRLELIESDAAHGEAVAGEGRFVLSQIGRSFVARMADARDPFGAQHRVMERRGARAVGVNLAESPLTLLRTRKDANGAPLLSEAEFLAGERLRRDFTMALMSPKVTATWPPQQTDRQYTNQSILRVSDAALAARQRFWAAGRAVGPELAPVLISVCCHLDGLETIEARYQLPKRSGKAVLKLALQSLARHYGYLRRSLAEALEGQVGGELPRLSTGLGEGG